MPELPEVETTRRGIEPHILGRTVARVRVRERRLRWPVPAEMETILAGETIASVERRAKYLLLRCSGGTIIIHLGMSGHLRLVSRGAPAGRHDHIDLEFTDGGVLRLNDARRFGAFLWTPCDPLQNPLLVDLGPEPLSPAFNGSHLYRLSRGRRGAVKPFIMDQRVVVGVGNIYACEALYRAGIHPGRAAGRISAARYAHLAQAVHEVLEEAIAAGGTTLRDFTDAEGRPGYFRQRLQVYGRAGESCTRCGRPIEVSRLGGRSTFYCSRCQR